ncbi:CDP-glucose 4,6-dehydratase [Paraburkholderia sp. T12-10]|nr:CDP-glucose 4,6-dehydratase [Paraburkholderia sp. T12-10]
MSALEFWRDRRVFLTGHTGFKGAWLALWLSEMGARVTGYALPPPTTPSFYDLARIDECVDSVIGDINDAERLSHAMQGAEPEVVFHLAAQPLVRQSYANPVETFATNVLGTVNLLEAVRRIDSVGAVVIATTDKCYANQEWAWGYRENDALGGKDPYSASKAAAEIVAASYRDSFLRGKASVVTARAGNVIGGGDFSRDRLVPDLVRAIESGTTLHVRYPHAIRPWQFVLEPLAGYLELAQRAYARDSSIEGAWNFGPEGRDTRTVGELVQTFVSACAGPRHVRVELGATEPRLHEAATLRLDISKACSLLSWRPRYGFDKTLNETASWYCAWLDGANLKTLSRRQLQQYADAISLPRTNK